MVSGEGIRVNPQKVAAVAEFAVPKSVRGVRSFLGLLNFFRKYIRGFSDIARPLVELTKKRTEFTFGKEQEEAFLELKEKLVTAPVLRHFSPTAETEVHTDSSDYGLGGILLQRFEDGLHPIAYASRKLSDAERRYNTTHKECLGIIWAIKTWRPYLWGATFKVVTDHHSLCWLRKNTEVGGRLARWAIMLQDYSFTIHHKSGVLREAPDCLSRYQIMEPAPEQGEEDVLLTSCSLVCGRSTWRR